MASFHTMDRIHFHDRNVYMDLPTTLAQSEKNTCLAFVDAVFSSSDIELEKKRILASLPLTIKPSIAPLSILSTLLTFIPGPWPVFDVQCCFARAWKRLPEEVKAGKPSRDTDFVTQVEHQVASTYNSLLDLLPRTQAPALKDSHSQTSLAHERLATFIDDFRLPDLLTNSTKTKVALALPNGPLLGLAILATTTYYTACPLSTASGPEQFRSDLTQSEATIVFVTATDVSRLGLDDEWVRDAAIKVVVLQQAPDMTFTMHCADSVDPPSPCTGLLRPIPNGPDDVALMLFTSGTSGTKKTVPITVHSLVSGVAFVIESWGLKHDDVCLNMMPLFHVGGIVRNLFAPIMAGGSTICCAAFDANSFWDIVEDHSPTWYYASPTMHQMILETSQYRQDALEKSKMRLICNAAGGLLPSLAGNLRDTFGCTVLPSYGMTECMPISSPPLDYKLDRSGTSGISVGPDLGILDGDDQLVSAGEIGEIAVRGAPLFGGYLKKDGTIDRSPFTSANWFRTGDMGYLDSDGFLFVTGRSKEVINRGGELISPFEVEEAVLSASQKPGSPIEGRVSAVLAFSMPHSVLQEVVGLVVVTPPGARKVCIKTVQEAVKESLSQVKCPQVIVFMDELPKNNNKVLRIKLGQRMDMEDLSDDVPLAERHYQAVCPPPNTPLSVKISHIPHVSDLDAAARELFTVAGPDYDVYVRPSVIDGYPEGVLAPAPDSPIDLQYPVDFDPKALLLGKLDDLDMLNVVHLLDDELPVDKLGDIDHHELDCMIKGLSDTSSTKSDLSTMESKIATLFSQILACPLSKLSRDSDFFEMGGDSLRAGKLLSELRRESKTRIPVDLLFTCGQISAIAEYIEKATGFAGEKTAVVIRKVDNQPIINKRCSSTNPLLLLIQLIPIVLVYPMKRALSWTIFMYVLAESQFWPTTPYLPGRIFNLIVSLFIGRLVTFLIAPLLAILSKWILIGRYRQGLYPMWGFYHTRWWLVQKIISISGKGHFGMSNSGLVLYYRLLGAKIGKNVTIAKSATLGEYDLLEIGDGASLDKCIFRAFAVEKDTAMYLARTSIGRNASVGLNAIVAPGTKVPHNVCIGPNSSSWETSDPDESNRNLLASKIPVANFLLDLIISYPLSALVNLVRSGPWIGGLVPIVMLEPVASPDHVLTIIHWFAEPYRIGYHYLALILHAYCGPIAWFLAVFVVKKMLDATLGKQEPGTVAARSQLYKLRQSILRHIIPLPQFHKLVDLFGAHYETTSMLYRALGAKVGQRVYWPGTGPVVQDFDLLDIGDDVVFGSRSYIQTSDGYGSDLVKVGNGAMISDRVVLLPGTTVGDRAVFGSGALSRRNKSYEPNTVWVGSRGGEAVCLSDSRKQSTISDFKANLDKRLTVVTNMEVASTVDLESGNSTPSKGSPISIKASTPSTPTLPVESATTTTPFGRAFYSGLAPYHVFGIKTITLYSSFLSIFTAFYWNVGTTTSVQIVAFMLPFFGQLVSPSHVFRPLLIYALFTVSISILQTFLAVLALALVIAAKWILLGRRKAGNYDWDKSPYCQRWQLYLTIERLRRHCYGGQGILGLLTGTHYMVLYFRALGAKIGRDCALFASGSPSCLFTEPDLLTLGDRVGIDDASLVCHINSRGVFDLNELHVGEGSVLRSGSRLLSGAKMAKGTVLMEHTLVMAGDEVEEGTVRQGWPGDQWEGERMPTLGKDESVKDSEFDEKA
ncbi:AMP-binding enzyme-like protein 22 [Elsinoe fawcettii]|nr:AMP-binding enzyme-like protein 22 [Elsinoe fawcettii]